MKKIYVISPYAGDVAKNVQHALAYCKFVMGKGFMPLASHLYFTQMTDDSIPEERAQGLAMGLELLALCDEAWVFYEDRISSGMAGEIARAKQLGIPLHYYCVQNGKIMGELQRLAG